MKISPEALRPPALIGEIRGVRPISPHITTSVSSSKPRCSRFVEQAAQVDRVAEIRLMEVGTAATQGK